MRGWIVVMVVLSLPGAAAAGDGLDMDMATLVADLEATCKNFKADRLSPKLAVLESNAFKSFCGLSREGMVKSAARRREPLSSSQAQTFLGRGYWLLNGAGGQYWRLHLESKPVMTDLDRLFYALSLQPATANLDRFLYRYDWNLAYYLAMKSIDPRRLVANLRADRRFVGSVKDLWMAKYRFEMRTQVAQIDKIRGQFKGRGPEYDKIFSVGATGLRSWAAGWRKHKGDAARMHKILGQLLSGRKLSIEDCEAPMFEFMAKQARSLGWSHPLIEMSAGLAGVCARRRNDAALEYAALMALSYRDATIGRFSRAVSEVNRYVDELAERTGQEPVIKRNKLTS
ncbi:MAG: hypothetical protein KJO07_11495, partial [Deltaproteobacteria bacterium]|nr:hypothetical protein [Deltaproteobacteria bacterium]